MDNNDYYLIADGGSVTHPRLCCNLFMFGEASATEEALRVIPHLHKAGYTRFCLSYGEKPVTTFRVTESIPVISQHDVRE